MVQSSLQPLLNTSWTLHRLSPLHHGKEFQSLLDNQAALRTYAARLRDHLTGDLFAGTQAGLVGTDVVDDGSVSRTGPLRNCAWETLSASSTSGDLSGILVVLEYENITYKAALLAAPEDRRTSTRRKQSTRLPLLLTRLPNPLRQAFISFLSTHFDTYCSSLRLPPAFLCTALDAYIDVLMSGDSERSIISSSYMLEDIMKEVQLTLSFSASVAPPLKSLNVNIPRGSFTMFARESTARAASEHEDEYDEPPSRPKDSVLTALSAYLERHLAMKLSLGAPASSNDPAKQYVRLTKIACGGFILGGEGKVKLVASSGRIGTGEDADETRESKDRLLLRANEVLLRAVLRRAASEDDGKT